MCCNVQVNKVVIASLQEFQLTGALGLMITLGGSCPWRLGVPGPPALGDPPPIALNRSGALKVL
jgi:hypothetical protein